MENIVVSNTLNDVELLNMVHNDLTVINSLLVFFVIVVVCYFVYKFFDMFFVI